MHPAVGISDDQVLENAGLLNHFNSQRSTNLKLPISCTERSHGVSKLIESSQLKQTKKTDKQTNKQTRARHTNNRNSFLLVNIRHNREALPEHSCEAWNLWNSYLPSTGPTQDTTSLSRTKVSRGANFSVWRVTFCRCRRTMGNKPEHPFSISLSRSIGPSCYTLNAGLSASTRACATSKCTSWIGILSMC